MKTKSQKKRVAVLFSGGKDSTFALFIAKKYKYKVNCLISIQSKNPESFMFHTPNIELVEKQAKIMNLPIITKKTKGEKERELVDLENAINLAIKKYKVNAIVTGAVESVYQASRIQKICNKLKIECFNPLWQKNQFDLLEDLIKNRFEIIIVGVFAYPFDNLWLGKKINKEFIKKIRILNKKYQINPAGEGGEYETFVLNCPLFKRKLKIRKKQVTGEKNSYKLDIKIK